MHKLTPRFAIAAAVALTLTLTLTLAGCPGEVTGGQPDGGAGLDLDLGGAADARDHGVTEVAPSDAAQPPAEAGAGDGPVTPPADAAPPWWKNGVAICPELAPYLNQPTDCSAALQLCVNRTPAKAALELAPGVYSLAAQIKLTQAITLRTAGTSGQPPCQLSNHGCAELKALPALYQPFGMIHATAAGVTVDHLVLNGNRQARGGTPAHGMCSSLKNNSYGFNGTFSCSSCALTNSASIYALCGTGFLVTGTATSVTVADNTFAYNGVHTVQNLWSDGLTVHDAKSSSFTGNSFIDNTDIDLIFGGCTSCKIQNNTIKHGASSAGGCFAALMIQKWPTTSGCYANVDVSNNSVDCGPNRLCGSGIYIGSESWYPETPYGTLTPGTTSGSIHHNSVINTMNGLYIAAQGLTIYKNGVLNTHGVSIPNSCHKTLVSVTPYVVSPTAKSIHFMGENVDPVMKVHFSSASWAGCIPNYPF